MTRTGNRQRQDDRQRVAEPPADPTRIGMGHAGRVVPVDGNSTGFHHDRLKRRQSTMGNIRCAQASERSAEGAKAVVEKVRSETNEIRPI